jgi:hypothetical protein
MAHRYGQYCPLALAVELLLLSGLAPHPRLRNGREHRLAAACGNA